MNKNLIPKQFTIAGITIKVKIVDCINNGSCYGIFNDVACEIKVANRVKVDGVWYDVPENSKINSFFHELFHAFSYYWNTETPEDLAQVFANFALEYHQTATYE